MNVRKLVAVVLFGSGAVLAQGGGGSTASSCPCPGERVLYAIANDGSLYRVDNYAVAPNAVLLGIPLTPIHEIAIEPSSGRLLGVGMGPPTSLYEIDPVTLQCTLIGSIGPISDGISSLEFTASGALYGRGPVAAQGLYQFDVSSGVGTFVGGTGSVSSGGIACDPAGVMYGVAGPTASGPRLLQTISLSTGVATTFAQITPVLPPLHFVSLEIDCNGQMYGWSDRNFFAIDKSSGVATLLSSSMPTLGKGLAFGCATPATSYCTAGTTSHGCVPNIGYTGTPSASASSGFALSVNQVEGQKQGLFFYGVSGPIASPWGTGSSLLCVKPPTQRMPVQFSGGVLNTCSGSFASDWNQFAATNPGALGSPFAGGEHVFAQAWFRDPLATKTTNLSNGLSFVVEP